MQLDALEETLAELRRLGRLEPIDAARVEAVRGMAVALDANPLNAQLWKVYVSTIEEMTGGDDADDLDTLLAELAAPDPGHSSAT